MLHHCVDTLRGINGILPDDFSNGHYLLVNAHRILNNQRDMALMVFDRETGKAITGAKVKVGGKRSSFDAKTQSFRRKKTDKQGILSIEVDGLTACYSI